MLEMYGLVYHGLMMGGLRQYACWGVVLAGKNLLSFVFIVSSSALYCSRSASLESRVRYE